APIEATVVDAHIKRIASQSNGWVILNFTAPDGTIVQEKLGLPVNIASKLMLDARLDIRYQADSFIPIVITKTAEVHLNVVRINLAIAVVSTLFTVFLAWLVTRFVQRKLAMAGKPDYEFVVVNA
ncbi:hypothetical protein RZS08_19435, partial [Arthrospira platensis SPKY1]|nr:hypothetical protein [Arthrospira platensis SPKY1]